MIEDIVVRLRETCSATRPRAHTDGGLAEPEECSEAFCWCALDLEAAAEIERLRAALKEIDAIAVRHEKGGLGKAQKIARAALLLPTPKRREG